MSEEKLNIEVIIELLWQIDIEFEKIFLRQWKNPIYYLIWGASIILDDINNYNYQQTKDLDFLWEKGVIVDALLKDNIIRNQIKLRWKRIDIEDEECFLKTNFVPGDITVEFLNYNFFVDNDNPNKSQMLKEFINDVNEYYINENYQFKYIKVTNAYLDTRIVTARIKPYPYIEYDENMDYINYSYTKKTLENINKEINSWIITKEDVIHNIWYLINKYYYQNELILNDWNLFVQHLHD